MVVNRKTLQPDCIGNIKILNPFVASSTLSREGTEGPEEVMRILISLDCCEREMG